MFRFRKSLLSAFAVSIACLSQVAIAQEKAAESDTDLCRKLTAAYADAFNTHDAAATARFWKENCVYLDRETGERAEGREAIQRDLDTAFKAQPDVRLMLEVSDVRLIQPNVARISGIATLVAPDSEPQQVALSAILVKEGDAWMFDSVEESAVSQPPTAREALRDLEWLVGDWVDQSETVTATSKFRWSPGGTFLIRAFSAEMPNEEVSEGTQVIGWDPRSREIRSWTFNSDGSFGEATWSRNGEDWLVKSSETLADGGTASGTYVMTPISEDEMSVRLIGHEVNGEPLPSVDAVKAVRVAVESEAPEAGGAAATGAEP
jgi:uncharacterized protein (TIGR02246 family)